MCCLRSLAFPEMFSRQRQTRDAASGTCVWIHDHPTYQNWVSQARGLLWIKGKPGAGKSTLMNYTLNALQSTKREDQVLAFFFFDGTGTSLQRSQMGLFRSLLHQILSQDDDLKALFANQFNDRWEKIGAPGDKWEWELKEIQDFLKASVMTSATGSHIRIIVDALDESGETNALEIVSYFEDLSSSCSPGLDNPSICFSCRHYPTIQLEEDDDLVICVEKENGADIETFVRTKLGSKRVFKDGKDAQMMVDKISGGASGVFQWVVLIVEQIITLVRQRRPLGIILDKIRDTPMDLNTVYQSILETLAHEDRRRSLRLFQWVCFAKEPLDWEALTWTIELDPETTYTSLEHCRALHRFLGLEEMVEEVKRLSGGLIEMVYIDEDQEQDQHGRIESPCVRLIHQSVYDFLVDCGLSCLEYRSSPIGNAHVQLLRVCLRLIAAHRTTPKSSRYHAFVQWRYFSYSAGDTDSDLDSDSVLCSLYLYATAYWCFHVKGAEIHGSNEADLITTFDWMTNDFFTGANGYSAQFICFDKLWDGASGGMMHCAARYGIPSLVKAIIIRSTVPPRSDLPLTASDLEQVSPASNNTMRALLDSADMNGQTPLSIAARYGHYGILKELLLGSRANPASKDHHGSTALHYGASYGYTSIVQELLTFGNIDPKLKRLSTK
ncbi:hypothetical protein LTR84_001949 [Exophiala bonariae]|uniref:Nephrocystin 3-like N-terminal domain-containing protein n=1 Tax=Exophiala bonariae TaxID=1690606 RepID=A0AAV9NC69_9EURO|nr:hypothetical protein LTR84_001949 [Exophiala bonariae]